MGIVCSVFRWPEPGGSELTGLAASATTKTKTRWLWLFALPTVLYLNRVCTRITRLAKNLEISPTTRSLRHSPTCGEQCFSILPHHPSFSSLSSPLLLPSNPSSSFLDYIRSTPYPPSASHPEGSERGPEKLVQCVSVGTDDLKLLCLRGHHHNCWVILLTITTWQFVVIQAILFFLSCSPFVRSFVRSFDRPAAGTSPLPRTRSRFSSPYTFQDSPPNNSHEFETSIGLH